MPKSIRILTEIGKDKSVQVDLNQEFDHLQILSLQFTQSELYQRMCSDYGVVVGRVSVNNGYGLPNAKVSIFIPLTDEDSQDPIISELYPYKTLNTTNAQGYQYNLLPQTPSYSNHVPTGSFPTKEQIMKDPGWRMVFDKYYKFSVTTNQSGDFMIFGVPLGEQKLVMNIDLSDIGEFSLTPQDMIRMGLATEAEVDGVKFKSSENFKILPQIVTIVKDVTILPLWGDEDLCQSSINRTDFDLSADSGKNIVIQPTAIFMGSLISTLDKYSLKRWKGGDDFCRVKLKMGELCKMTTGPGEILAIRHTIDQDSLGRPILEQFFLESNGKVIDGDGTWLIDVPMNLNYVITDQFGNQVPSLDTSKGIPTTARYRFKIKWQQPDNFDQDIKRGYFLVPNVKEWGWTTSQNDPNLQASPPSPTSLFTKSYSFSLDWDDYGDSSSAGQQMIQEAILCEDRFYEFYYNKVYTVSQLIDQYRGGRLNRRYNSIKNILDEECEAEVLKFPTNDAQWRPDFLYLLFSIFLRVITPVLIILLVVLHIIGFLLWFLAPILTIIMCIIFYIVYVICVIINSIRRLFGGSPPDCVSPGAQCSATKRGFDKMINDLRYFPLPNLTYPDCEMCNCTVEKAESNATSATVEAENLVSTYSFTQLSDWISANFYDVTTETSSDFTRYSSRVNNASRDEIGFDRFLILNDQYESLPTLSSFPFALAGVLSGIAPTDTTGSTATLDAFCPLYNAKDLKVSGWAFPRKYFSTHLTMAGRLNLFNTKSKYFNNEVGSLENPSQTGPAGYGNFSGVKQGPNQIKVSYNYTAATNNNKFHYDNIFLISCDDGSKSEFLPGRIVTFQDLYLSTDLNALSASTTNDEGIPCITGTTRSTTPVTGQYGITNVNVKYASPLTSTNGSSFTSYDIVYNTGDTQYHRWPIDVEYFQVITAMTISEYESNCSMEYNFNNKCYPPERIFIGNTLGGGWNNTMRNSLNNRFIFNNNLIRTFGNWNIQRPDFWVYQDLENCYPIWGAYNWNPGCARTYKLLSRNNLNPSVLWEVQSPVEGSSLARKQVLVFLVRGVDPYSTRNENSYDLSILFGKGYGVGPIITGKYKLNIPIQEGTLIPRHNKITSNYGSGSLDPTTNSGIYYQNFSYQPSSDFSGFTSYLHRFYSCIDLTNHQTQFAYYGNSMSRVNSVGNDGFDATTTEPNTDSTFRINPPRHGSNPVRFNQSNVWFGGESSLKYGIGSSPTLLAPKSNTFVSNLFCTTFDFHMGKDATHWYQNASNCNNKNKGPNIDVGRWPQELFGSQNNCSNCGPRSNLDQIYNGYPYIGRMAFSIGKFGVIGSEGLNHGGVDANWQVEGTKWSVTCGMGFWVRHGGFEPDGYFLARLNSNVGDTPGFNDNQTIKKFEYMDSRGYYPFESIEGGEVFAFRLKGSKHQIVSKTSPAPYNLGGNYNLIYTNTDSNNESNGIVTHADHWRLYYGYCNTGLYFNNDIDGTYYPTMRLFSGIYQLSNLPNPYFPGVTINTDPNVTMFNGIQFDTTTIGRTYTVMRTDRLPSSSRPFEIRDYGNGSVQNFSYLLHNNPNFAIYTFDDDGITLSGPPIVTGQNFPADASITADTAPTFANIIETTNECNKMLPLRCYYNQQITNSGVTYWTINSSTNQPWRDGSCTSQNINGLGDRMIFDTETGCYQLASRFILSLRIDIELLLEWKSRLDITFGACRNVFSHIFTNQWINGMLYAYSFKNDKIIASRTNQISGYRYCYDTLFLHPVTNSYFYRSSPWEYDVTAPNNGIFIGKEGNTSSEGGNKKYLNNPTTIIDLGPKTEFLQQIVQNDNFDGYIMKDLRDSTFGDTSDILNFFILSRLLNTNFFDQLFGTKGAGILGMFTRVPRRLLIQPPKQKNFIDADVAQMFSINSEIGVDEFEVSNYPFADSMYYNPGANSDETVIGVFFNSTQQVRDFLTPRRTIFNPNTTQASWPTSFGYIPQTKTQYVPFYNWELKPTNTGLGLDIFGSQQNDWATDNITGYYYQSLDRLNVTQLSNYMSPIPSTANITSSDIRGYIFNYNPAVNLYDPDLPDTIPYSTGNYQNNGNAIPEEVITHGAPFHFYFGLKKGKTALDRFLTKYTQDTDLI